MGNLKNSLKHNLILKRIILLIAITGFFFTGQAHEKVIIYKDLEHVDTRLYYEKFEKSKASPIEIEKKENHKSANTKETLKKLIFIKLTPDTDTQPSQKTWKEEIEKYPELILVNSLEKSDLIFEFRIKRAIGETRVSVTIYRTSDNKKLWSSKKYRGTANVYNRMGASLHGIRKCISKGIIPALENGDF